MTRCANYLDPLISKLNVFRNPKRHRRSTNELVYGTEPFRSKKSNFNKTAFTDVFATSELLR